MTKDVSTLQAATHRTADSRVIAEAAGLNHSKLISEVRRNLAYLLHRGAVTFHNTAGPRGQSMSALLTERQAEYIVEAMQSAARMKGRLDRVMFDLRTYPSTEWIPSIKPEIRLIGGQIKSVAKLRKIARALDVIAVEWGIGPTAMYLERVFFCTDIVLEGVEWKTRTERYLAHLIDKDPSRPVGGTSQQPQPRRRPD
jgi:hypothetical protein